MTSVTSTPSTTNRRSVDRTRSREAALALPLALLCGACWADFPDSRLTGHDGKAERTPAGDARADGEVRDLIAPDQQVCSPGAFIRCVEGQLVRCNAQGSGEEREDCQGHPCNAAAERCDECDAETPPVCVDVNHYLSCVDGLLEQQGCSYDCENAVDDDQDGESECEGDCDDDDERVFSAQTEFQEDPLPGPGEESWDYNCDGVDEQELTAIHPRSCNGRPEAECHGEAWVYWLSAPPDCGDQDLWVVCVWEGSYCSYDTEELHQRCR